MKLSFVGIDLPKSLEGGLLTQGFQVEKVKSLADLPKAPETVLLLYSYSKSTQLQALKNFRKNHPHTFIALIVSKKTLSDREAHNALIACSEKNTVWIEGEWETTFWFSLQHALHYQAQLRSHAELETSLSNLKSYTEAFTRDSEKLVAQLEKDVGLAETIQRSLLPKMSPEIPGVSLAVKYIPATGLGGDYYDIFEFGDRKRFGVLLADSKTHGMAAALLNVLVKLKLEEMKERFPSSNSFIEFLNQEIRTVQPAKTGPLSLLYGILDRASLSFHYTAAGPLAPILWRRGHAEQLPCHQNPSVGELDHFLFRENVINLEPGDLLVLHTDGLEEPFKSKSEKPLSRILKTFEKIAKPDPISIQNEFLAVIDKHVESHPLKDDLTLINLAIDQKALYLAG